MWEKIKRLQGMEVLVKFWNELKNKKKKILKFAFAAAALFLLSFAVEFFGFGGKFKSLVAQNKGLSVVDKTQVKTQNFVLNEKGEFVSQSENAILIIQTEGKYVNNLELDLGGKPKYDLKVEFQDPETGKEVVLENRLEKSMQKGKFSFLNFAVYRIQNSPQEIAILAPSGQTTIAQIKIDNAYRFNAYRFLFVLAIFFLLAFLVFFRKKIGQKPEMAFFVIVMICGTFISFAELRTYVSWDEKIHYDRSDDGSFKGIVRKRIDDIFAKTNAVPASYSLKEQKAINEYFDNKVRNKISKNKDGKSGFSVVEFYNRVGYWPSRFALFLGRILHLPNHWNFVFGRWINVLVYASVIFFAIKKLKSGKLIMATVALFPTAVFLASNYGYDWWVTAFTLLGLAYFFSELQQPDKKITTKEMVIMLGAFVVGLGPKAIYFPLMLLLFLLGPAKFSSPKQYKKFLWANALAMLFVLASFLLPFVVGGPGKGDTRGGEAVNSAQQVKFILAEPFAYAKILTNFMASYINPFNAGGFMTFFAYLGSIKGFYLLLATTLIVAFTDKNKCDKETSGWKIKTSMLVIYLAIVALISSALYVSFTAVRSETIAGVQPRYLIPLIFPLLFVLGSSKIKNPLSRNLYAGIVFTIMAAVTLVGSWDLIVKLYY